MYLHMYICSYWIVCVHNGTRYEEGDQIQPNCSTRCVCTNGNFQCEAQNCITDGATCYAYGDPQYITFDQRYFNFQGTCEYVLTRSCNTEEFSVVVTNLAHNQYVSCTDTVRIVVPNENLNILLGRGGGGTVTINDIIQPNIGDGVILSSGQISVVRVGGYPHVILSNSGVRVSWDGLYRAEITVSTSWRGRLCGLCGNYNGDPNDDFQTPDGSIESSSNAFGFSWVLGNGTQDTCSGTILSDPCPPNLMSEAQTRCAELNGVHFNACHNFLNPTSFIDSCIYDYCYSNQADREHFYYNSLATYASACATNGVILPPDWQNITG